MMTMPLNLDSDVAPDPLLNNPEPVQAVNVDDVYAIREKKLSAVSVLFDRLQEAEKSNLQTLERLMDMASTWKREARE